MLQTVLETDSLFGVVRANPEKKKISDVGCCAQIIKHHTSEDGRSNLVTLGQQRFRILEIVREAPFYTAMVSWIDDSMTDDPDELVKLADSVLIALKDVVSLTGKLTDSERTLPEELPKVPRELSFWIASHLGGPAAEEQQSLLEMLDTKNRLKREYEMLDHTRRQLAARTALKETLSNADKQNN